MKIDILEIAALLVGVLVGLLVESVVCYLVYNYFVATQLHLPTGTWFQILAVMALRNMFFIPLIQVYQKTQTK